MIEFLFLLVEILAIVYLIHNIVGVSVKVDVYLIMLLAIGLGITIAIINDFIEITIGSKICLPKGNFSKSLFAI